MGDKATHEKWMVLDNIKRFERQLEETPDEAKRRVLRALLQEERRKLDQSGDE